MIMRQLLYIIITSKLIKSPELKFDPVGYSVNVPETFLRLSVTLHRNKSRRDVDFYFGSFKEILSIQFSSLSDQASYSYRDFFLNFFLKQG